MIKINSSPVPLPKINPAVVDRNPMPTNKVEPLGFKVFSTLERIRK